MTIKTERIMTKEQTIAAAKVMLAWAEGKQVEYRDKASKKEWVKVIGNIPLWDWWGSEYRIKPEPAYRPFETAEEVMEAIKEHGDWVKQGHDIYRRIDKVTTIGSKVTISLSGMKDWGTNELENLGEFRFLDGTPFGKPVEK